MIQRASYDGQEFVVGELYFCESRSDIAPLPWRIYRLIRIENIVLGAQPDMKHRFTFQSALSVWGYDKSEYTIARPRGWSHVALTDLGRARMRLDEFIVEEAKSRGMK